MPIWALTQERLEKLNHQIKKKQEEHDTLKEQSEEDLWCKDLDAFMEEWLSQLENDAGMQDSIRKRGRRASQIIRAGQLRKDKVEDEDEDEDGDGDYMPTQKPASTLRKKAKAPTQRPSQ
jgi:DNA topoisomerase-2